MKQNQKVFKDGVAQSYIESITEQLPSVMFIGGLILRACIAGLLYMHTYSLVSFIKNEKIRIAFAGASVFAMEFLFISFSLATAQIRHKAYKLKDNGQNLQGNRLLTWSYIFFSITLIGSLLFNGFMLYFAQQTKEASSFFTVVSSTKALEIFIFVQVVNLIALFSVEGSAFLLNSNTDAHIEPQKVGRKSNEAWEVVNDSTIAQKLREKMSSKTTNN